MFRALRSSFVVLSVLIFVCCNQKRVVQVVYFGNWQAGEVKSCLQARDSDLLFCDLDTYRELIDENDHRRDEWSHESRVNLPELDRLNQEANEIEYRATHAKSFQVTFVGSGTRQDDVKSQRDMKDDAKSRLAAGKITKFVANMQLTDARYRNDAKSWKCRSTSDGFTCE